jgi:hypothetical protein
MMKIQWAIEPTFRLEIRARRDEAILRFQTATLYASLFIASQVGQSLCKDQIELLRDRLDPSLRDAELASWH